MKKQTVYNPKHVHQFDVDFTTEDGEHLRGTFSTKRLSVMDRTKIGVRKSQMSGGMYCIRDEEGNPTGQGIDEDTDMANAMFAHLEISLVQKPTWWNLDEIVDMGLVREVYTKVVEFEMKFFRSSNTANAGNGLDGSSQDNGNPQSAQGGSGGSLKKVVGQEVQASLDA